MSSRTPFPAQTPIIHTNTKYSSPHKLLRHDDAQIHWPSFAAIPDLTLDPLGYTSTSFSTSTSISTDTGIGTGTPEGGQKRTRTAFHKGVGVGITIPYISPDPTAGARAETGQHRQTMTDSYPYSPSHATTMRSRQHDAYAYAYACSPCSPRSPPTLAKARRGHEHKRTISTLLRMVRRGRGKSSTSMTSGDWSALIRETASASASTTSASALSPSQASKDKLRSLAGAAAGPRGWASIPGAEVWSTVVLIAFWISVVVFFSALLGVGAKGDEEGDGGIVGELELGERPSMCPR